MSWDKQQTQISKEGFFVIPQAQTKVPLQSHSHFYLKTEKKYHCCWLWPCWLMRYTHWHCTGLPLVTSHTPEHGGRLFFREGCAELTFCQNNHTYMHLCEKPLLHTCFYGVDLACVKSDHLGASSPLRKAYMLSH